MEVVIRAVTMNVLKNNADHDNIITNFMRSIPLHNHIICVPYVEKYA